MVKWIKSAGLKAVKDMANTAVAIISASFVLSDVDWIITASACAMSGIVSMLTSIKDIKEIESDE